MESFATLSRRLFSLRQKTFRIRDGAESTFVQEVMNVMVEVRYCTIVFNQPLKDCNFVRLLGESKENGVELVESFDPKRASAYEVVRQLGAEEFLVTAVRLRVDVIFMLRPGGLSIFFDNDEYATLFAEKPGTISRVSEALGSANIATVDGYNRR